MKYSIDRKEKITLGGMKQTIHIWGSKAENPVVLFLHDKKMGVDSKQQFVKKVVIGVAILAVSIVAKFVPFLNEIKELHSSSHISFSNRYN